jgi:hypothetical protein
MIAPVNNSLNGLLAAFSDVNRTSSLTPQTRNIPIEQTRRIAPEQLRDRPEISEDVLSKQSRSGAGRYGLPDERQPSLASFAKPKPLLAPSDEAQLFARAEDTVNAATQTKKSAERPIDSELAKLANLAQPQASIEQRRQSYVAQLYAQTNDITFSSDRILNQAA